ncbi:MAG: 3',5'-cyclic AMP phosphodiesterase CpdA [Halioglobus sp.]
MQQQFAHLSDPHLTSLQNVRYGQLMSKRLLGYISWRRKRRHEHSPEVLAALSRDLIGYPCDQLLVTGDLTHIGLPDEFQQALAWLKTLGNPQQIALVPGNHDATVKAPRQSTLSLWDDYFASDKNDTGQVFPSLRIRGQLAFIGLSSACPSPPLMATGTLDKQQLSRLPEMLRSAAEQRLFRVVYVHHSPLPGTEKWRKRMTNAQALQAIIKKHGAELMLHGHGHRGFSREIETPWGSVPVLAVPSASALGLYGADVAHYNRFKVEKTAAGWQLDVHSRGYNTETGEFTARQNQTLQLARA